MHNDPAHNATWDLFWRAHPGPEGTFTPEVGAGTLRMLRALHALHVLPGADKLSSTRAPGIECVQGWRADAPGTLPHLSRAT